MRTKYLSLILLLSLPVFLSAQEVIISGEALYNTNFSLINGSIMDATLQSTSKTKGAAKRNPPAKLNFVRSEPLSLTIQQDFISRLSKEAPDDKSALEKAFSGNKLRTEFDRLLAGYGYSGKNLADAMTAYLVISWQVVNGQEYNDRKGFDAVRKMIRENLLSSDYLKNATDQDKQIVSETFAYQAMLAMNAYRALVSSGNRAEMESLKISIDHNLKNSGMGLKGLTLTTNGFVKK